MLNFYTVATGKYKKFVIPYLVAALSHNNNSFLEILVDDKSFFDKKTIDFIYSNFRDRYAIKKIPKMFNRWLPYTKYIKSIRWLTIPTIMSDATYIGDVDIMILDSDIEVSHRKHANFIKKPYSNLYRNHPCKNKLTGLHYVLTKPYYTILNANVMTNYINNINSGNIPARLLDECLLYTIVNDTMGIPDKNIKSGVDPWEQVAFRPTHGIHISLHRRLTGWGITQDLFNRYLAFSKTSIWQDALKIFTPDYIKILNSLGKAAELHIECMALHKEVARGGLTEEQRKKKVKRIVAIEAIKYV